MESRTGPEGADSERGTKNFSPAERKGYYEELSDADARQYTSIGDDEMVLLCGGETTAWQTFQDIGRVLNYVARIFSAGSSIVNNVVTIVNYFNKLEDLLPVIGEV